VAAGLASTALLSILTGLGVIAWAALVDGRPEVVGASALAAVALGLQALAMVPEAAFHASNDMAPSVRAQVWGRVLLVAATAGFLALGMDIRAVFAAQILDAAATLGLTLWAYRRVEGGLHLAARLPDMRALLTESLPFGLNLLFGSIYLSVDVLLLAVLCDDTEVGIYRGAVMLISLFPVIANTLTTGIFPRMARKLGDPVGAGEELGFASRVLLAISVPAAVGGMMTAGPLMVLLGGDEFAVSALAFVIMAPLLPLRFLNNAFAMTLSTLNRQADRTRGVFVAALLNLGLNLLIIPRYGASGAAATTLVTEIALTLWFGWRMRELATGLGLGASLLRVGAPALAMGLGLWLLPPLHVILVIGFGVFIFAGVGLLTGAWRPQDLRRLRRV
jgi:O-antigen/teichoic acid export membrane protein